MSSATNIQRNGRTFKSHVFCKVQGAFNSSIKQLIMLEPPHNTVCQIYEQCLQPKDYDPLIYFEGIWCKMQK